MRYFLLQLSEEICVEKLIYNKIYNFLRLH